MTDKTDLIREIHEYVTTHGGENTATHLLVQAASAIQTQAAELEAVGAGGVQALRKAPAEPYSLDSDPDGIRAMVADAITGALAFGAQGINPPPEGHWLAPFWNAARAELAAPQPAPAPLSEQDLRTRFEALARDSYNFRRSRRDCYVNPATARDWKWFRLGANVTEQGGK